jgi:hypothetical protein
MGRIHAFEFNDVAACPAFVRDSVVEILGHGLTALDFGGVIAPSFSRFVQQARVSAVLDLASGTGVPARLICDALGEAAPSFWLSDIYPNAPALREAVAAHPAKLEACMTPVDATAVPRDVAHDARTIINAFHHFRPALAHAVLADAIAQRKAVFIYEGFPRQLRRLAATMPAMGPCVWLNPFRSRRARLLKGLFTYLLPVIPLVSLWDAVVSVLRIYSEPELRALAEAAGGSDYHWAYQEVPYLNGAQAVVFTGIPKERLA